MIPENLKGFRLANNQEQIDFHLEELKEWYNTYKGKGVLRITKRGLLCFHINNGYGFFKVEIQPQLKIK